MGIDVQVLAVDCSVRGSVEAGVHPLGRAGSHIKNMVAVNDSHPSPYMEDKADDGVSFVVVDDALAYGYVLSMPLSGDGGDLPRFSQPAMTRVSSLGASISRPS